MVTVNNVVTTTETTKFKKFVNDEAPLMPSLEKAIKELFTGSKFMIDYERNLVVARGTEEQLQVMEKIIEEFDRPIQQVLIEARFVTISKPAFLQLGVLWETDRQKQRCASRTLPAWSTTRISPRHYSRAASPNPALGIGIQETFTNVLGAQRPERHHQRPGAKRRKPDLERPAPDGPEQPSGHHQRRQSPILLRGVQPSSPPSSNTIPPLRSSPAASRPRSLPAPS